MQPNNDRNNDNYNESLNNFESPNVIDETVKTETLNHGKIIQPINSDIKPEDYPKPVIQNISTNNSNTQTTQMTEYSAEGNLNQSNITSKKSNKKRILLIIAAVISIIIVGYVAAVYISAYRVIDTFDSQNNLNDDEQKISREENLNIAINNADTSVYMPRNYSGPIELVKAGFSNPNPDEGYIQSFYLKNNIKLPTPDTSKRTFIETNIFKDFGEFNPPSDCGRPNPSSIDREEEYYPLTYPCELVLETARGRKVYGHRDKLTLYEYGISDRNSESIRLAQPDIFYIKFDDDIYVMQGPGELEINTSLLTPEVLEEFVDSLEPLNDTEYKSFIEKYIK